MAKGVWRPGFDSLELGREDADTGCLTEVGDQGGEGSVSKRTEWAAGLLPAYFGYFGFLSCVKGYVRM